MKNIKQRFVITLIFLITLQTPHPGAIARAEALPAAPQGTVFTLPLGKAGTKYEYQFQTEGGLAPLSWQFIDGELPPGIKLESSGKLTGTPTTPQRQAYRFVVEAADSSQPPQKFAQACLLSIQAAPLRIVTSQPKLSIVPTPDTGVAQFGQAFVRFDVGELGVPAVRTAAIELAANCPNCATPAISPATLRMLAIDRSRWRHGLEFGSEFNQDLNNQFGSQFFTLGLVGDTHWGKSFHTQFEARLTSVLQRDTLMELTQAVPAANQSSATNNLLFRAARAGESQAPAADTPTTPDNLALFFKAKRAFESSLSVFWDDYTPFKETRFASDRTRFGPILKYQFRTRIDRQTETEKADIRKLINDPKNSAERKQQLEQALRFNSNLGPGEDEIRFSVFVPIDLSRLSSAFKF